jgi:hypothetical protein
MGLKDLVKSPDRLRNGEVYDSVPSTGCTWCMLRDHL